MVATACYQDLHAGDGSGSGSDLGSGNAVAQLGVGARFACVLDGSGQIACWGNNGSGQLGPGVAGSGGAPTVVPDAPGPWTQLAVGAAHACGVSAGLAYCWGDDTHGQVGVAAGVGLVPVPGVAGVTAIAAGSIETCAIGSGSALTCWGNVFGTDNQLVPFLGAWSEVSVGFDDACGIVDTGGGSNAVECWGACQDGECGDALGSGLYAFPVGAAAPARVVVGDRETCVIDGSAHLGCAGIDQNMPSPLDVDTRAWTDLAIGPSGNGAPVTLRCGVVGGIASCWGQDQFGGLGNGTWSNGMVLYGAPVRLGNGVADRVALGLPRVDLPADFDEGGCALAGSAVECWGDNRSGELPTLPAATALPTPIAVAGVNSWGIAASSSTHTCALGLTGTSSQLYCWGQNDLGEVTGKPGDAACPGGVCATPHAAPVQGDVQELVVGEGFSCAESGDQITCWGNDTDDQLGPGQSGNVNTFPGTGLVGGGFCACANLDELECWGHYEPDSNAPMTFAPRPLDQVTAPPDTLVFAADSECDSTAGTISCWGVDAQGELGDGSSGDVNDNPTPDIALANASTLLAGSFRHYCAVGSDLLVYCWGTSYDGESGISSEPDALVTSAQPITTMAAGVELTVCASVAVGQDYGCAVCQGEVWCWGNSVFGALGDNSGAPAGQFDAAVPVQLETSPTTIVGGGFAGANHTCALSEENELACWGFGPRGELGTGGHGSPQPIAVAVP
jgi:alpha-tubulin suppressor-like RCC1 family protein